MKYVMLIVAILSLIGSSIACCTIPQIPEIEINVPTIDVGEVRNQREEIPLGGAESAHVDVLFGAGDLEVEAGVSDQLLSAQFRYNVEQWEPEVTYTDGTLTIQQGDMKEDWGVPTGNTHNEWKLEFSPEIPLEMNFDIGAGNGDLDLTGLQISNLDLDMGAGDFEVRFEEPNEAEMDELRLDTGASKVDIVGIGNASPENVVVNGGVGDLTIDLSGDWRGSADVEITAGIGSITLRLPDDVGVRVETEGGLTNVEAGDLRRSGEDAYVNDAYGEAELELLIRITTGIGTLRLDEVSNN
jgi:hypothetical protein